MNLFGKWFAFFAEEFIDRPEQKAEQAAKPQQADENNELHGEYLLVDEPDSFDWAELADDVGDGFNDDIDIDTELGLDIFEL